MLEHLPPQSIPFSSWFCIPSWHVSNLIVQSNYHGYRNGIKQNIRLKSMSSQIYLIMGIETGLNNQILSESNLFRHKYTFSQTILKTSMLGTILPTSEFYSVVFKILAGEKVLRAANSKTSLIDTTIPCCYKFPVCTLEPVIGQNVNSRGQMAICENVCNNN